MKKYIFLTIMLFSAIFSFASCKNSEQKYNTVNIIIDGKTEYTAQYINDKETTALDLLKRICEDKNIKMEHLDGHVNSIAGINNTVHKTWVYDFNGQRPDVYPSNYIINKGYDNVINFSYLDRAKAFEEAE